MMTAADILSEPRRLFGGAVMNVPVLAGIVAAAVNHSLPHLAGRPDSVVVDLFREDGDKPGEVLYGLTIFDADNPPSTGAVYAGVPLLIFSDTEDLDSDLILGSKSHRRYAIASPTLREASSGALERRAVAMAFWIAADVFIHRAKLVGGFFDPLTDRLATPPITDEGEVDLGAMLWRLDPNW
jgi:hypothetical protein